MRLRVSILFSALLCGATAVSAAGAAGPADASFALKPVLYDPSLTATKSYFILAPKPGAVIKDKLRIVNTGGKTGTAFLYPVDATTGQTSGAVYLDRTKPRRDVGGWITIGRSSVRLAPGADAVVPFTIHVPRNVRAGDHLGGIVAENAQVQSSSGHGALQIKIRHLTITAVQLQFPGTAVGKVVATGVRPGGEHGYQYVYVHLKSTANVMLKPAAVLTVRNAAGRVVSRRAIQLDTFLPGTAIDYPALLPRKALAPGSYTAAVRVRSTGLSVPGYRKAQPPAFDVSKTFPFTVSSSEQTKVFSGVAPVTPPTQKPKPASSSNTQRGILVALLGLMVVALALLLLVLRRSRKRKQGTPVNPSPVSGPPSKTAAAQAPVPAAGEEEPGWAGLLAAYESQPRHQLENGWGEAAETAPGSEPEPNAPDIAPEPEQTPDMPTLVPMLEAPAPPAATPIVAAPLAAAAAGAGAGAAAAAALAPEPAFEPAPAPVPVLASVPEPEQVPEPGSEQVPELDSERVPEQVPEPGSEHVPERVPEFAFELQPEPWFQSRPEVEELPEPEVEEEPGFELRAEPWFEPVAALELEAQPEPEMEPGYEPEPDAGSEFASEPEFEELSAVRPAAEPTTVIDPDSLKDMIVRHDLSVAEAYFRPEPNGAAGHDAFDAAQEPESHQEAELEPAAPPAGSPQPQLPVAVPADVRAYAEANNLSSALVEASLIALAAVIATRLLRNDD